MEQSIIAIRLIQSLAVLTFVGFMLVVFIPHLQRGNTWKASFFKNKKTSSSFWYFFAFYVVLFYSLFLDSTITRESWIFQFGTILAFIGLVVAFIARIQLRSVWKPITNASKSQKIIDTGAYKVFRHPIYVGRFLFFLGVMLMFNLPGVLIAVAYWAFLRSRLVAEEQLLMENSSHYREYAKRVKRIIF